MGVGWEFLCIESRKSCSVGREEYGSLRENGGSFEIFGSRTLTRQGLRMVLGQLI